MWSYDYTGITSNVKPIMEETSRKSAAKDVGNAAAIVNKLRTIMNIKKDENCEDCTMKSSMNLR
jgi:hypothetical protein